MISVDTPKAPPDEDFAFVKVNEMWDEELQASESEEESASEETQQEIPEQPRTRLQRKRQREQQEKTNTIAAPSKRIKIIQQEANNKTKTTKQPNNKTETKRYLEMLYNDIAASTDKLFIIAKKEPGKKMKDWMDCFECGTFHWGAGLCDDCSTQESDNFWKNQNRAGNL